MKSTPRPMSPALFMPVVSLALLTSSVAEQSGIDPEADRLLKAACTYLAAAKAFSVEVEVWKDTTLATGRKIQTSRQLTVHESRPGSLRVEMRSPRAGRGFWLRDKSLVILDRKTHFYGIIEVPESIDGAIDAVEEHFGIAVPVGDVLGADPYKNFMDHVETADHFGKVMIQGISCEHLAFTGPNVDFQIWITDGAAPLIRMIVIDFKNDEGRPQLTQLFTGWDLTRPVSDAVFVFVPPPDAEEIPVAPAPDGETNEKPTPEETE